jgi:nitric oxide reductase NorD protein
VEPSAGGDNLPLAASATEARGSLAATPYPEWDYATQRYRPEGATVHSVAPVEGTSEWADEVLREHAVLVRRVRQRFERLRSRRSRLGRQREGDELDLAACVDALVDRRTSHAADDRLYVAVRPARRALAIALLVDVSGSTDAPVTDTQAVIDVEKTAVLLASEALDALGDRYTVMAFSGRGAANVRIATLKSFAEPNGEIVRRRVAALAPEGNTRLGAAVRYANAALSRQPAGHRLLLLLSDGRPNDADGYQGRYAVEDARQAVAEARSAGVYPYCLTVDREGPEYLARIFGAAGHSILRHPEHLPLALVQVVRHLLAS